MGLYIVKKLCDNDGIFVVPDSAVREYQLKQTAVNANYNAGTKEERYGM